MSNAACARKAVTLWRPNETADVMALLTVVDEHIQLATVLRLERLGELAHRLQAAQIALHHLLADDHGHRWHLRHSLSILV